jgi:integrase
VKSASKSRKTARSHDVKVGSVTVKIYESKPRGRALFTVTYRDTNNRRVKKSFADLEKAKTEAYAAAAKIQSGQIDVLELKSEDRIAYQHAIAVLKPTGQPLDTAAEQYAEAFKQLNGSGSLLEAARYFRKHHTTELPKKSGKELYEEFLASKKADNASPRYVQDIQSRLGRFAKHFGSDISLITTRELEEWIGGLGCGPVARNGTRSLIITLFNFARQRGYLPKNQPTEAEAIALAKEPPTQIGIFTPAQMGALLEAASDPTIPYFAIGGFAGLRHAELMRLDWREIKLEEGHIEVTAQKAKTAQRRIVPIQANLAKWLYLYVKPEGQIFGGHPTRFLAKVTSVAKEIEVDWPHNALRHSFASYRLAQCKSAAEVALEMGNSPRMVFQHYRELVTAADSEKWWSIAPK